MGTWGTSLYSNDSASDIRGDYVDKLKRGKSNEDVTQELIAENKDIMGDDEEEPLFWFALADTQWNYGRLLPEVKEKALDFLSSGKEDERWKDAGQTYEDAWKNTLDKLKSKLQSPQPKEKKVAKYRLYKCKWELGDVYAYQFDSEYSKENNYYKQYCVFRKVSEDTCWPGHIVPVVKVYKQIFTDIPSLETLKNVNVLEQCFYPTVLEKNPNVEREYCIDLMSTSEKVIPKEQLTFLGNIKGDDIVPFMGRDYWLGYTYVGWEQSKYNNRFEHYIIDMYNAWKGIE